MSRDNELHKSIRAALHDDADRAPAGSRLDAGAAIAGARRRRRPKVAIATGATAFAAVGILAISLPTILQPMSMTSTSGGAPMSDRIEVSESQLAEDQSGGAADSAIKRAPAERIAMCESPMPFADAQTPMASMSGVVLELVSGAAGSPPSIAAGTSIDLVARLSNPTSATITGATTTAAAAFLGINGMTSWHTPGNLGAVDVPFSLAPGASIDVPVTVAATTCSVDDDLAALETGVFPADIAAAPAGAATVIVALDVRVDTVDGADEGADAPELLDLALTPAVPVQITD